MISRHVTSAEIGTLPRHKVSIYPAWLPERPDPRRLARLAEEIRHTGILAEPLDVWRLPDDRERYYLLRGFVPYCAAGVAGLTAVPTRYYRMPSEEHAEREFLLYRLRSEELSPMGRARAIERLVKLGMQPETDLKHALNVAPALLSYLRRLEGLPWDVQWLFEMGALTAKHGRFLLRFAPWPNMVRRLAAAAVANDWPSAHLEKVFPRDFGLTPGAPEPSDWPVPGSPPFGPAWRPPRVRRLILEDMERWVKGGRMDAWQVAHNAAQMVAEVGVAAALDVVGWHSPALEEGAMALGGRVEEELDLRDDGRRDDAARKAATVYVWTAWLQKIAATDPLLVWRIGADSFDRWEGLHPAEVWLPPRVDGEGGPA
ncbi:MAG TPA: hypothetical protein VFX49_01260 [Chloroflexota bacterium]|nr:hypothetical protein [Chloroflexota bacterium]